MKNMFWTGYSREERIATIRTVTDIIGRHGHVVDFKPFSDLSLTLRIEVEESRIDALYQSLAGYLAMKESEPTGSRSTRERTIYLDITFIHGRGDLVHEIPAVPG